jgi:hypothetical protein
MPALAALGALIACIVAGVALIVTDHTLIGVVLAFAAIPAALVAWVMVGDRA